MRKRREDGGAAAVEFALILPLFAMLVFGMIQYGFYFLTAETANSSARETARRIVVGDCWSASDRDDFAEKHAPRMTSVVVSPAPVSPGPAGNTVGAEVTVTVTADANIINFLPMPNGGIVTREYEAIMEVDTRSDADSCTP
jgi:Flp pilus assembly protein TadG